MRGEGTPGPSGPRAPSAAAATRLRPGGIRTQTDHQRHINSLSMRVFIIAGISTNILQLRY